jgi:hypothetical protein
MGQATRRELALGLRSVEASLLQRHVAVAGGGGAGLGLARLNDGGFTVLLEPCAIGPRAVTASMLRRSLPFQHTLLQSRAPMPEPCPYDSGASVE